jgi:hypothetical protein
VSDVRSGLSLTASQTESNCVNLCVAVCAQCFDFEKELGKEVRVKFIVLFKLIEQRAKN